jgi:dipeptidyl aminopeptidase/acylaminoacyl peptidase
MTSSRRPRRWGALAIAVWVTSVGAHVTVSGRTAGGVTGDTKPLRIDDALGTLSFAGRAPIALSPDGELVAFTLLDARRRESTTDERYAYYTRTGAPVEATGGDVWIANVKTAEMKNLTGAQGTSWAPAWSPDGQWLAFYSDRRGSPQVWVWSRRTGALRRVAETVVRPFFNFEVPRWSPDGSSILFKALPQDLTLATAADLIVGNAPAPQWERGGRNDAGMPAVRIYRSPSPSPPATKSSDGGSDHLDDGSWSNRYLTDLALADVKTGQVRRLVRRIKPVGYWFSPDGQRIAFTAYKGFAPNTQQVFFDLDVIGLRDAQPHVIVPAMMTEYGLSVSWSPDGRQLAYTTAGQKADGRCFVVPSAGGEPRPIEVAGRPSFSDDHRAPLWDRAGRHLYLLSAGALWRADVDGGGAAEKLVEIDGHSIREIVSPTGGGRFWSPKDDETLVVSTLDRATRQAGFFWIDLATAKATPIVEEDKTYAGIFGIDAQSRTLVYAAQDAQHPPDLWVSDDAFASRRRVTRTNPQLESYVFGGSWLIAWKTVDGRVLHGAVLLPPDFREGVRYPLIVNVYGGSLGSNNVNRFGLVGSTIDNQQLLATRGYVVFAPDIPIQTGTPMRDIAAAVLPGVDEVVRLGLADPQRLGVMGHSYGGYSTLALIVQTTRFRAAVASAAQADLFAAYGQMNKDGSDKSIGWAETGQGAMGGTPWALQSRYLENSPFYYLDRAETPVLLIHGELDTNVPASLADQVFVGLRRLGKEVTYARYEREDHWQGTWGHANVVDYWTRVIAWFDRYLGAPAKSGG